MLPAVRYDYYKTGLNRDVRSDAPIPRRQPSGLGDKRRFVGRGPRVRIFPPPAESPMRTSLASSSVSPSSTTTLSTSRSSTERAQISQMIERQAARECCTDRLALGRGKAPVGFAPVDQTSTCSAMARASSTSMPRYLTVLSILVCPDSRGVSDCAFRGPGRAAWRRSFGRFASPSQPRRLCQFRVSFRDRDRNPDVLDPADGRLEQNAKNKKAPAVPYRVIHRVIVTVIVDGWKS